MKIKSNSQGERERRVVAALEAQGRALGTRAGSGPAPADQVAVAWLLHHPAGIVVGKRVRACVCPLVLVLVGWLLFVVVVGGGGGGGDGDGGGGGEIEVVVVVVLRLRWWWGGWGGVIDLSFFTRRFALRALSCSSSVAGAGPSMILPPNQSNNKKHNQLQPHSPSWGRRAWSASTRSRARRWRCPSQTKTMRRSPWPSPSSHRRRQADSMHGEERVMYVRGGGGVVRNKEVG